MKFILILGLTFSIVLASAQQTCQSFEELMMAYYKADSDLEEAINMFEAYSALDCADMLLAYNFIGFAYYNISNFEKAREYFILGENVFSENEKNYEQFAINQMYTGLILVAEKDFESSLYHLNKAAKWVNKVEEDFIQASIYQNTGLVYIEKGELDEGEKYLNKAVKTGGLDSISIGYIYQNLAFLNLKRDNKEKTQEFILKTKDMWNALEYPKGIYLLSFLEAKLAIKEKEYNEALDHLVRGRSEYKVDNKLLSGENYLVEAQIHERLNNKKAQLFALENAILESDDLSDTQLRETISNLSSLQDANKTNIVLSELVSKLKAQNLSQKTIDRQRNKIMDTESDEDQSIIKKQIKYLFLLGSLLLLLSYLFFRIKKQNQDIQKLNTDLSASKLETENQVQSLKQKNKELEQFAYVASHDLKSPLRTISSFSGLLKKKYSQEDANKYLDIITRSAQNMSSMISELLRHSTLDQKLQLSKVNLNEIIEDTIQRINTQIVESQATINIDDSCDQVFLCDRPLFINVFQNLISNSITYCKDEALPEINISASKQKDQIVIKLSDNGIGMDAEFQDQIFEMFTRLKTKDVDGTGIGLSTCKKIVENHNGTISVESTLGAGSIFTIILPQTISA